MSTFVKDSYTLNDGDTTKVVMDVMVPLNATAGERATFLATAVSGGNATRTSTVLMQVEVAHVFGMESAAISGSQDMLPGEERTLELLVRNTGNGPDEFTVGLTDPGQLEGGWWVEITDVTVQVPLRDEVIARLVLVAPEPALAGTSVEFTVTVSSEGSPLSKDVPFFATVVQFHDTHVEIERLVNSGDVGETIVIPLTISNGGNGPVDYNGDINFPDASWVGGLDMANMTVEGYGEASTNLAFTVPEDAINRSYDFTLVVISSGGEVHLQNFTFSVHQFHDLLVSIESEPPTVTQGQPAWVRLRLENMGNGVEEVTLTASPPSTWTFEYSIRMPSIDPLSDVIVDLRLDTDADTPGGTHLVDVLAYYGPAKTELVEVTASVEVMTRPDLVVTGGLNLSDEHPYVDSLVRVTVAVTNDGQTQARDVFAQLYVDDVPQGQAQYVSSIEPGGTETLTFVWTTNASGLRTLRVVVDFQGDIDEVDEDNNEASATVDVSKVDLKTSPGLSVFAALLAISASTAVAWNIRSRRRGSGS
jgi:uncharacterized membrane protein